MLNQPPLIGRDEDLQTIRALLTAAQAGESGGLVIFGPPGIGKTTLLREATATAREAGMTVLAARGYEGEADLPYGALLQLLRPVISLRNELPDVQRQALGVALALEPPVPLDQFAVPAAVLNLLALAAARTPLLVVVDDLQWVDEASAAALIFATRRLGAESVAVLGASREDERVIAVTGGLPVLRPRPLAEEDAITLVTSRYEDVPRTVAAVLAERSPSSRHAPRCSTASACAAAAAASMRASSSPRRRRPSPRSAPRRGSTAPNANYSRPAARRPSPPATAPSTRSPRPSCRWR